MKKLTGGLVVLLLIAGAGIAFYLYPSSRAAAAEGEQPLAGTGPARVLLNEILFQPSPGQSPFVELINAGGAPAKLDGLTLVNQADETYALASGLTVPAGEVLLIRLDGAPGAPPPDFIHRETGSLILYSGTNALDEALWSTAGGPSFNLGRGGYIPAFVAATTLGRPRNSTGRGPTAWTVFDPADATARAPNAFPQVTGLMPLPGAIVRASTLKLSWYGVPTAARYRIQVAVDRSFASPAFDGTSDASGPGIASEQITTPTLPPGRYFWRVQPIFGADSRAAAFSRPAIVWLEAPPRAAAAHLLIAWLRLFGAPVLADAPEPAAVRKLLPIPLILQRKDTSLLATEAAETGAQRWDAPWPLATGPYCAKASVAMVAARYGGTLSQDRITYEAFKDFKAGPIFDLYTGNGYGDRDIEKSLTFALGSAPAMRFNETLTAQQYFDLHRSEIDQGFPVVATTAAHAFVVVGYGEDERGKYLTVNDPAFGQYDWLVVVAPGVQDADEQSPASTGYVSTSFLMPRNPRGVSDEPTIHQDSDGDGVMDFDESKRFGTNPLSKDSDSDGVGDKEEIRAWVHKDSGGWATVSPAGRLISDEDGDGKAMQVDADSDGGGCVDGMEDTNSNGKFESALREFSNFDKTDDDCVSGTYEFFHDTSSSNGQSTEKVVSRTFVQYSLRGVDGRQRGVGILTYAFRREEDGPFGSCESDFIQVADPYQYVVPMQGTITPLTDGTVTVDVKPTPDWIPPAIQHRFVNCSDIPPFEVSMGTYFGLTGNARNGVFNHRENLPLGSGQTGTNYSETHIRLSSSARR